MRYCLYIFLFLLSQRVSSQQTIIFSEDFESASLSQVAARWSEIVNQNGMLLSNDVPPGSLGKKSLMVTSIIGQNTGGHLYKMFDRGYDSLYYRFYVKFAITCHSVHHFVHIGGYYPPTRWPQGGAGEKPQGNERFTSGIEPMGDRWEWDFYSYWMHMRGNPQPNTFWGNDFNPIPAAKIKRGEWICVEAMMKVNNPASSYNGEQVLWINGTKIMHLGKGFPNGYWVWDSFHPHPDSLPFEGFQWRSDENLKLNFFWLMFYMTKGNQGQIDTVWFDDIVVSTKYSGPLTNVEHDQNRARDFSFHVFPNPFSRSTTIRLTLTRSSSALSLSEKVGVRIFDLFGREVATLFNDAPTPGEHLFEFDAASFPAGLYHAVLSTPVGSFSKPMLLMR